MSQDVGAQKVLARGPSGATLSHRHPAFQLEESFGTTSMLPSRFANLFWSKTREPQLGCPIHSMGLVCPWNGELWSGVAACASTIVIKNKKAQNKITACAMAALEQPHGQNIDKLETSPTLSESQKR